MTADELAIAITQLFEEKGALPKDALMAMLNVARDIQAVYERNHTVTLEKRAKLDDSFARAHKSVEKYGDLEPLKVATIAKETTMEEFGENSLNAIRNLISSVVKPEIADKAKEMATQLLVEEATWTYADIMAIGLAFVQCGFQLALKHDDLLEAAASTTTPGSA